MEAWRWLTVPVVPRDRWFICWVRGAMTVEGWMDKLGSMAAAGVITAPWEKHVLDQVKNGRAPFEKGADQYGDKRGEEAQRL